VSHFHHLPRVELSFRREGAHVGTVPAAGGIKAVPPALMMREAEMLWQHQLRPAAELLWRGKALMDEKLSERESQ
jgi:hypothetical protein